MAPEIWFSKVVQLFILQSESNVVDSCQFIEDMMWHSNSWFYYVSALNLWFPCLWMKFWPIALPWGGKKTYWVYNQKNISLISQSKRNLLLWTSQHMRKWICACLQDRSLSSSKSCLSSLCFRLAEITRLLCWRSKWT